MKLSEKHSHLLESKTLLKLSEAAEILSVSERTVRRMAGEETLEGRSGPKMPLRITSSSVLRFLAGDSIDKKPARPRSAAAREDKQDKQKPPDPAKKIGEVFGI